MSEFDDEFVDALDTEVSVSASDNLPMEGAMEGIVRETPVVIQSKEVIIESPEGVEEMQRKLAEQHFMTGLRIDKIHRERNQELESKEFRAKMSIFIFLGVYLLLSEALWLPHYGNRDDEEITLFGLRIFGSIWAQQMFSILLTIILTAISFVFSYKLGLPVEFVLTGGIVAILLVMVAIYTSPRHIETKEKKKEKNDDKDE